MFRKNKVFFPCDSFSEEWCFNFKRDKNVQIVYPPKNTKSLQVLLTLGKRRLLKRTKRSIVIYYKGFK